jgi:Peptidogalycan biosysnthesis/recognition
MTEVTAHTTIDDFELQRWDRLFPGELEGHAYLRAIERAGLPGFRWLYFAAREDGKPTALAPAFVTDYQLDTTVQGGLRRLTKAVSRRLPRLLRIPMLALGSPVTERCRVGFEPDAAGDRRAAWLDAILARMESFAAEHRLGMLAVKDAVADEPLWQRVCPRHGLRALPGLPGATLDVSAWRDVDGYLGSLGHATRKDLRRKRRAAAGLEIAWRTDLAGVIDDVVRLYRATLENSQLSFEELTPAYFENVLSGMPGRAFCVTYSESGVLLAFNLVLCGEGRLLDKFFGMDYAARNRYNLYHASWLENVRYCIERGLRTYESGQGLQREKARLGSTLNANTLWYRHRNRFLDGVFARVERLARLDRLDDDTPAGQPAAHRMRRA